MQPPEAKSRPGGEREDGARGEAAVRAVGAHRRRAPPAGGTVTCARQPRALNLPSSSWAPPSWSGGVGRGEFAHAPPGRRPPAGARLGPWALTKRSEGRKTCQKITRVSKPWASRQAEREGRVACRRNGSLAEGHPGKISQWAFAEEDRGWAPQ